MNNIDPSSATLPSTIFFTPTQEPEEQTEAWDCEINVLECLRTAIRNKLEQARILLKNGHLGPLVKKNINPEPLNFKQVSKLEEVIETHSVNDAVYLSGSTARIIFDIAPYFVSVINMILEEENIDLSYLEQELYHFIELSSQDIEEAPEPVDQPFYTIEALRIPLKEYWLAKQSGNPFPCIVPEFLGDNFMQFIIDAGLKILRPLQNVRLNSLAWAKTACYLSKGYSLSSSKRYAKQAKRMRIDQDEPKCLTLAAKSTHCHPLAVAFEASKTSHDIPTLWKNLPAHEEIALLNKIQELIVEDGVSMKAIQAYLCFIAFAKSCYTPFQNDDISTTMKITPREVTFAFHTHGYTFNVPSKPLKYEKILIDLSNKELESLSSLWDLLIPSRVNTLCQHDLYCLIDENHDFFLTFANVLHNFANSSSMPIKKLGFNCLLAYQGRFLKLESIYKSLYDCLPSDIAQIKKELEFLSQITTPNILFASENITSIDLILDMTCHLIANKQRFYGYILLNHCLEHPTLKPHCSAILFNIVETFLQLDREEALFQLRKYLTQLLQEDGHILIFRFIEVMHPNDVHNLLSLTNQMSLSSLNEGEKQLLIKLYKQGCKQNYLEEVFTGLERIGKKRLFDKKTWEQVTTSLIEANEKVNGIMSAFEVWQTLNALMQIPCPSIFVNYFKNKNFEEPIISLSDLNSFSPDQVIIAIKNGYVNDTDVLSTATEALKDLIKDRNSKILIKLFNKYDFSQEIPLIKESFIELYLDCHENEFEKLLWLSSELKPFTSELLSILGKKFFTLFPLFPERIYFELIQNLVHNACTYNNCDSALVCVQLLKLWKGNNFSTKLSHIFAQFEISFFNLLLNNSYLLEATEFLRFIKLHDFPVTSNSVKNEVLYRFFENTTEQFDLFSFALEKELLQDHNKNCQMLFTVFLHYFPKPRHQKLLKNELSKLTSEERVAFYSQIFQAFGENADGAIQLISDFGDYSKTAFEETEKYLLSLDKKIVLSLFENKKEILHRFKKLLITFCQSDEDAYQILNFIKRQDLWDKLITDNFLKKYASQPGKLFEMLINVQKEENVKNKKQIAFFEHVFKILIKDTSCLEACALKWQSWIDYINNDRLLEDFISATLTCITNPSLSIHVLKKLFTVREKIDSTCKSDATLITLLVNTENPSLLEKAVILTGKYLTRKDKNNLPLDVYGKILHSKFLLEINPDIALGFTNVLLSRTPLLPLIENFVFTKLVNLCKKNNHTISEALPKLDQFEQILHFISEKPDHIAQGFCDIYIRAFTKATTTDQDFRFGLLYLLIKLRVPEFKSMMLEHFSDFLNRLKTKDFAIFQKNPVNTEIFSSVIQEYSKFLNDFPESKKEKHLELIKTLSRLFGVNYEKTATFLPSHSSYFDLLTMLLYNSSDKQVSFVILDKITSELSHLLNNQENLVSKIIEELFFTVFCYEPSSNLNLYIKILTFLKKCTLFPIEGTIFENIIHFTLKNELKDQNAVYIAITKILEKLTFEQAAIFIMRITPIIGNDKAFLHNIYKKIYIDSFKDLPYHEATAICLEAISDLNHVPKDITKIFSRQIKDMLKKHLEGNPNYEAFKEVGLFIKKLHLAGGKLVDLAYHEYYAIFYSIFLKCNGSEELFKMFSKDFLHHWDLLKSNNFTRAQIAKCYQIFLMQLSYYPEFFKEFVLETSYPAIFLDALGDKPSLPLFQFIASLIKTITNKFDVRELTLLFSYKNLFSKIKQIDADQASFSDALADYLHFYNQLFLPKWDSLLKSMSTYKNIAFFIGSLIDIFESLIPFESMQEHCCELLAMMKLSLTTLKQSPEIHKEISAKLEKSGLLLFQKSH